MDAPRTDTSATDNRETEQVQAKVYSLSERGLDHSLRRLALGSVLLVILAEAIAITVYLLSPSFGGRITPLATAGVILVPLLLLFLIPADIRRRRALWRSVMVELGDNHIAVRHVGVPGIDILPQPEIIIRRDQVTAIQETAAGLAISTHYDPQALIIPAQLEETDRQEITATLSTWCAVQPDFARSREGIISRIYANIRDSLKRTRGIPPFYMSGDWSILAGIFGAGAFIALVTMVLVVNIRDLDIPKPWAIAIIALYIATIFGSFIGFPIALAWLDYGLAHIGAGVSARSGLWAGIAVALFVGFGVAAAPLSVPLGLAIVSGSGMVAFGLAWLASLSRIGTGHVSMSRTVIEEDLTSYALVATSGSASQIQGAFRLTFAESFAHISYHQIAQPRFCRFLRVISIPLPREVNQGVAKRLSFNHPYRNRVFAFSIDAESVVWKAEGATEFVAGWDQVTKVMRTPTGFLLYWNQQSYEWMPLHAFFAQDGPEAFAELARRLTVYSEMP